MAWLLSDVFGVEDDLQAMGQIVWVTWVNDVRPSLLDDPTPTNTGLRITQTPADQVWIPGTDVYVRFFPTNDGHVMLIEAVDLNELL